MIQRVSDPFDDLVMDSNKSLKSIYKGSRRNGVRMAKRKKGMTFIPYDYEAAYNKSLEDMHEFFVEQMFKQGKKVVYALKEIRAGDQFEVEIYPQFKKMDEVPPEGRSIKKDNDKAQRNLNDKNARKYVERLINENFTDRDLWLTFTYDNEHLPPDGDIDAAIKNVQKFIRRVNYQRKKRGLPNARYVYVTAYNPTEEIRWHHHIVMDGDMDMDVVEGCWKQSSRNEVRRLQKDENGLTGMAKYIVEEKNRVKSEKRWNSSQGLRDPDIKVVHSKRPTAKAGGYKKIGTYVETMRKGHEQVREQMLKWYPDFDFTDAGIYYNDFNSMFYIQDSGVISMDSSPDIIKDASDALKPIEDRGITVMQGWYDKDLNKCHVTLWDLGETDDNFSDDDAEGVTLSLQITIFSKEDEVELAREIKSLMKENGFSFEGRNGDDSKPEDGIYMKAQRFTKYYESEEKS